MVVVDTSVWVDFFRGSDTREADYVSSLLGRRVILLGDLVLAELLQGFKTDREVEQAKSLLRPLAYSDMVGEEIALASARNYRLLRQQGITLKTIDVIIATFCVEHSHVLLHSDGDFDRMRELLGLVTL